MGPAKLPALSPLQVVELQDALLANADGLLHSALAVLDLGNVGLARALAILGMEESGKAIAIHERRVSIAYAPEGESFVDARLEEIWRNHDEKLKVVHRFLTEERYWFGVAPADPEANHARLGTIKRWASRHNRLKQRGFYVDVAKDGAVRSPDGVPDRESLADVIEHIHQIGWQLRLGEHIEAKRQAEEECGLPPMNTMEIDDMWTMFPGVPVLASDDDFYRSLREGHPGRKLNNLEYRLRLREPGTEPFANVGRPGYEAETRELRRLRAEREQPPDR